MFGRLVGLAAGLIIAVLGYGLMEPAVFAEYVPPKYLDLANVELGPFAAYRTIVAGLTIAVGVAVALAALQRSGRGKRARPPATMLQAVEDAHAHAPAVTAAHDDHGHGQDDHGHGHDDHGHGHDDHDHSHQAHDDHGHHGHGHDDHGRDDHGHQAHDEHEHEPAHH